MADLQPLRRIEGLRAVAKVGKDRVAVLDSKGFQLFAGPGLKCERNLEQFTHTQAELTRHGPQTNAAEALKGDAAKCKVLLTYV